MLFLPSHTLRVPNSVRTKAPCVSTLPLLLPALAILSASAASQWCGYSAIHIRAALPRKSASASKGHTHEATHMHRRRHAGGEREVAGEEEMEEEEEEEEEAEAEAAAAAETCWRVIGTLRYA